jgi:hypothetical protein
VRLQHSTSIVDHSSGTATVLIMCNEAGDKTRCTHTIEDIICYSGPMVSYSIEFYLPRGPLLGIGTHCNYPTFCYKRLG